ncbi:hypothetical protein [Burkholderia pseudomallei]|uniref:hypothetical protein n=1 Tax=Burkholderia pseudomallei TaxID=28450 RepID=UPI0015FEE5D8|nr:hypothetical protein [Burkholderia pseudomallei]
MPELMTAIEHERQGELAPGLATQSTAPAIRVNKFKQTAVLGAFSISGATTA